MKTYSEEIKAKVFALRVGGLSLGRIHTLTGIPKTTIRDWVPTTAVPKEKQEEIKKEALKALQAGRIKAQAIQKKTRLEKEKKLFQLGLQELGDLNSRDKKIALIALYWAEGFKNRHEHRLGFCNSDADMILFYIQCLKDLGVRSTDLVLRVSLNTSYREKVKEVEIYWSKKTGISLTQFTKPFYQETKWKKEFIDTNYYGVLRIHVKDSLEMLLKMKGWIEGLKVNMLK